MSMADRNKYTDLIEWLVNMNVCTKCYMTHYHRRQVELLTQLRSHIPDHKQVDKDGVNFFYWKLHSRIFSFCISWVPNKNTSRESLYKAIGICFVREGERTKKTYYIFLGSLCRKK